MSLTTKLIWLGEEPTPPAEPRFLSYFQWRYKRFRRFTLPVRRLNMTSMARAETIEAMRQLVNSIPPYPRRVMAQYGVALLPVHNLWDDTHYMLGWFGGRGHDRKDGYDYIGGICVNEGHLAVVAEKVRVRDRGWTTYLQPDGVGESEAFAECFAVTQGKGGLASNSKDFLEHFPRCLEIVRSLVDKA